MSLRIFFPACLFALFFAFGLGSNPKPNLVLITIDTLRADHLSCYGYKEKTSPTLDRIASGGMRFQNAYSAVPITLASHATILTGVYPNKHGYRDNAFFAPTSSVLVSQILKKYGYQTAAFVSGAPLSEKFGLNRGFGYYDDDFPGRERSADQTTERVLRWLGRAKSPYFVWVHYYDPHAPYDPPEPYRKRFAANFYDGEIAYVDSAVGKLQSAIANRAVFIITADHGESLGEHGESTHGVFLYDATLRVPLLLLGSGIKQGVRTDPVTLCDIAPTLLQLAGVTEHHDFDGVSLLAESGNRSLFAESLYAQRNFGYAPLFASIQQGKKFILAPEPEFYDLTADPNEKLNLISKNDFQKWKESVQKYATSSKTQKESPTDPAELEKLRSLGYVGGKLKGSKIDPKSKIGVIEQFNHGMVLMYSQQFSASEQTFRDLVKTDPDNSLAYRFLGDNLSAQEKYEDAVKAYSASIKLLPDPEVSVQLAKAYNRLNDPSEAETILKQTIQDHPDYPEASFELASLYESQQNWQSAIKLLSRDLPDFANQKGILYLRKNEPESAVPEFVKALQSSPKATYWNNLGIAYQRLNRLTDAEKAFTNGLMLNPDYAELEANLSFLLVQLQRWQDAYVHLQHVTLINPKMWGARFALGVVLENLNQPEKAIKVYQQLLSDAPSDWPQRQKIQLRLKDLSP